MKGLRRWMFEHVYRNDIPKAEESKAQEMIAPALRILHEARGSAAYGVCSFNGER